MIVACIIIVSPSLIQITLKYIIGILTYSGGRSPKNWRQRIFQDPKLKYKNFWGIVFQTKVVSAYKHTHEQTHLYVQKYLLRFFKTKRSITSFLSIGPIFKTFFPSGNQGEVLF